MKYKKRWWQWWWSGAIAFDFRDQGTASILNIPIFCWTSVGSEFLVPGQSPHTVINVLSLLAIVDFIVPIRHPVQHVQ